MKRFHFLEAIVKLSYFFHRKLLKFYKSDQFLFFHRKQKIHTKHSPTETEYYTYTVNIALQSLLGAGTESPKFIG